MRYGIGLAVRGSGHWAWCDVPAQGSETVEIAFQPARRGLHAVPPLTALETYALFGEALLPVQIVGFAVALAGVLIVRRPQAPAGRDIRTVGSTDAAVRAVVDVVARD